MEIRTCAPSLIQAGSCCEDACTDTADLAVLTDEETALVEHTRCSQHALVGEVVAVKPLDIDPIWL